jgi:hypothetical protein
VDGIKSIFPKYKQQLSFLGERERLFDVSSAITDNKENETVAQDPIPSSNCAVNPIGIAVAPSTPKKIPSSYDVHDSHPDETLTQVIPLHRSPNVMRDCSSKIPLPDTYRLSSFPSSLLNDIDSGDLSEFNSHCKNRQVLIDAIFYDLTTNFNISYAIRREARSLVLIHVQRSFSFRRYPYHQEYDMIVDAILNLLKTQKSTENIVIRTAHHG